MIKSEFVVAQAPPAVKSDNRIFFRNLVYDVKAQVKNVNNGERFGACIKDISGSGMGLSTGQQFGAGTIFEIALEIPDGFGPLKLLGRVVWSRELNYLGYRTGIVILNPRFMSVSRILKLFF
jgi:hypothetical protein